MWNSIIFHYLIYLLADKSIDNGYADDEDEVLVNQNRKKRETIFDYIDTDDDSDVIRSLTDENETNAKEYNHRTTREISTFHYGDYEDSFSNDHEYFIEVMVVADKQMADYHKEKLQFYIMTLMSQVSEGTRRNFVLICTIRKYFQFISIYRPPYCLKMLRLVIQSRCRSCTLSYCRNTSTLVDETPRVKKNCKLSWV